MVILGKALGGGILPISAVAARDEVLGATPVSTDRPSAAIRWRSRSPAKWSRCWRPASTSSARAN